MVIFKLYLIEIVLKMYFFRGNKYRYIHILNDPSMITT